MSLDHHRIVAQTVATLNTKGFALDSAPRLGSTGQSAMEVLVDALADATVDEIETNGGAGTGGTPGAPFQWTQSAPATTWGPVTHTLGRRANVNISNSAGQQMFGTVLEPVIGSFVVTFSVPVSGTIQYW